MAYEDRDAPDIVVAPSGGGRLAAFVIGIVVGAGAALLLAPQSGAETRADIVRKARRARRTATRFAGDVRERAEELVDNVKVHVDASREAGKSAARAARDDLRRRLADVENGRDGDEE